MHITTLNNTNTFGFWHSELDAIPVYGEGIIYRIEWRLYSDQTNPELVPTIRLRATAQNYQQSDDLTVTSVNGGNFSPTTVLRSYYMYFIPPESAIGAPEESDDLILNFDVYSFDDTDAFQSTISLDRVSVEAITALDSPQHLKTWEFASNSEDWTFGSSPEFSAPTALWEPGKLILIAQNNTNTFGFWSSPAQVSVLSDRLYRASYFVKTEVSNPEEVPSLRLRINTEQYWAAVSRTIESRNGGTMSPTIDGRAYDLYFYPPQEAVGTDSDKLIFSFDLLNFDPEDAPEGNLILNWVSVYSYTAP